MADFRDAPPGCGVIGARKPALRALRGRDPLGLRRAFADRLLPALVGAMALLAALALAGAHGAGSLADRWQLAASGQWLLTLSRDTPLEAALARLAPVAVAQPVEEARLRRLLAPWLGDAPGLPLPRMFELRAADDAALREAVSHIPVRLWSGAAPAWRRRWCWRRGCAGWPWRCWGSSPPSPPRWWRWRPAPASPPGATPSWSCMNWARATATSRRASPGGWASCA
jgi:hypothetical protein